MNAATVLDGSNQEWSRAWFQITKTVDGFIDGETYDYILRAVQNVHSLRTDLGAVGVSHGLRRVEGVVFIDLTRCAKEVQNA